MDTVECTGWPYKSRSNAPLNCTKEGTIFKPVQLLKSEILNGMMNS